MKLQTPNAVGYKRMENGLTNQNKCWKQVVKFVIFSLKNVRLWCADVIRWYGKMHIAAVVHSRTGHVHIIEPRISRNPRNYPQSRIHNRDVYLSCTLWRMWRMLDDNCSYAIHTPIHHVNDIPDQVSGAVVLLWTDALHSAIMCGGLGWAVGFRLVSIYSRCWEVRTHHEKICHFTR